jgi:hypothetical protein
MNHQQLCTRCGQNSPTRYAEFRQVIGLLVLVFSRASGGNLCRGCARKLFVRTTIVNLTLGMCSVVSVFAIPLVVLRNVKVYRRVRRQLSTDSNDEAVARLPWASMIGAEDSGIGGRRLTLPVAAVGLSGLALGLWVFSMIFVAILTAIGPLDNPPAMPEKTPEEIQREIQHMADNRHLLYTALPFVLVAFGLSAYWQYKSENRPDAAPDLLVKLFPLFGITQVGRVHLTAFGFQEGDCYRIVVCAQNLFSDRTLMRANINELPELVCDLPPSGVCLSILDWPVPADGQPRSIVFSMSAMTDRGGGARVRYSERQALSSGRRDNTFALATALAGHGEINLSSSGKQKPGLDFCNRQGQWRAMVIPMRAGIRDSTAGHWETETLWEARQPNSLKEVALRIAEVVKAPLLPTASVT